RDGGERLGFFPVVERDVGQDPPGERPRDPVARAGGRGRRDDQEAPGGGKEPLPRRVEEARPDPDSRQGGTRRRRHHELLGLPARAPSRSGGGASPSSSSCPRGTRAGACVMRSMPEVVFGKAITSRSDVAPAAIAQIRSSPRAMPP